MITIEAGLRVFPLPIVKGFANVANRTNNMEATAEQFEFLNMPKPGTTKRVRSKWDEVKEMIALSEDENIGELLPQWVAPVLLDVTKARVQQLVKDGRLRSWTFLGKPWLSMNDIVAYHHTERKAGRPVGMPPTNLTSTFRRLQAMRKEPDER